MRRIAEIHRSTYTAKVLTISVDADVPVGEERPQSLGDAMLCCLRFQNLLKNTCEAAPDNGKPGDRGLGIYSVKLLTEAQYGRIELVVSDDTNSTVVAVFLPRAGQ